MNLELYITYISVLQNFSFSFNHHRNSQNFGEILLNFLTMVERGPEPLRK